MKILVLSPKNVLPPIDGGRISIFNSTMSLARRHNVFMAFPYSGLTTFEVEELKAKYKSHGIEAITFEHDTGDRISGLIRNFFSGIPYKMEKYFNKRFLIELIELVRTEKFDFIYIHVAHMAYYGLELRNYFNGPLFLREHNIQYELLRQYYFNERNVFRKLVAYWQYKKTFDYEIDLWKKFESIFFISDIDMSMAQNGQKNQGILLYDGVESNGDDTEVAKEDGSFIYSGGLDAIQNRKSLYYFIDKIWKRFHLEFPEQRLYLTGNTDETIEKGLGYSSSELKGLNIKNLGFVDDIDGAIRSKKYFVSPTMLGSGLRIKVLKAMALRSVLFVSELDYKMVRFLEDMTNVVLFRNYEEFRDKFMALEADEGLYSRIGYNALMLAKNKFNWDAHARTIEAAAEALINRRKQRV